jgi:hypothetical protein
VGKRTLFEKTNDYAVFEKVLEEGSGVFVLAR